MEFGPFQARRSCRLDSREKDREQDRERDRGATCSSTSTTSSSRNNRNPNPNNSNNGNNGIHFMDVEQNVRIFICHCKERTPIRDIVAKCRRHGGTIATRSEKKKPCSPSSSASSHENNGQFLGSFYMVILGPALDPDLHQASARQRNDYWVYRIHMNMGISTSEKIVRMCTCTCTCTCTRADISISCETSQNDQHDYSIQLIRCTNEKSNEVSMKLQPGRFLVNAELVDRNVPTIQDSTGDVNVQLNFETEFERDLLFRSLRACANIISNARFVPIQQQESKEFSGIIIKLQRDKNREDGRTRSKDSYTIVGSTGLDENNDTNSPESKSSSFDLLDPMIQEGRANGTFTDLSGSSCTKQDLGFSLVLPQDRKTVSDFMFCIFAQFKRGAITHVDLKNARRKDRGVFRVGYLGFRCSHCGGKSKGQYFPTNVKNLQGCPSMMMTHLLKCEECPKNIQRLLQVTKPMHKSQFAKRRSTGVQKSFFYVLWNRIRDQKFSGGDMDSRLSVKRIVDGLIAKNVVSSTPESSPEKKRGDYETTLNHSIGGIHTVANDFETSNKDDSSNDENKSEDGINDTSLSIEAFTKPTDLQGMKKSSSLPPMPSLPLEGIDTQICNSIQSVQLFSSINSSSSSSTSASSHASASIPTTPPPTKLSPRCKLGTDSFLKVLDELNGIYREKDNVTIYGKKRKYEKLPSNHCDTLQSGAFVAPPTGKAHSPQNANIDFEWNEQALTDLKEFLDSDPIYHEWFNLLLLP